MNTRECTYAHMPLCVHVCRCTGMLLFVGSFLPVQRRSGRPWSKGYQLGTSAARAMHHLAGCLMSLHPHHLGCRCVCRHLLRSLSVNRLSCGVSLRLLLHRYLCLCLTPCPSLYLYLYLYPCRCLFLAIVRCCRTQTTRRGSAFRLPPELFFLAASHQHTRDPQ